MTAYSNRKPLRIGLDGRELMAGTFTGFGRYIENFLNAQVTQESGHKFIIYGNQFTNFPEPKKRFTHKVIHEKSTLWWDQMAIVKAISQDDLDVFFTPYDKIPLRATCPVVMTIHDLLYQYVSDLSGAKRFIYNTLYRLQRGYMARHAAKVLTVSEHSRQDIAKYYGLNPEQITVTHNAVSARFTPNLPLPKITAVKKKYGISNAYIFNLNNFKPHKNASGLVNAYAQLDSSMRQNIPLVIGGHQNAFTDTLRDQIKKLKLSESIILPGPIEDEDLPALYAGATCFVISSYYEGFGIPPLEAMASGTPVISSNATSLPEVVGDAGVLVSPHDTEAMAHAMSQVLNDETLRKTLSQKGLKRANIFTQEKVATRILTALENTAHTSD